MKENDFIENKIELPEGCTFRIGKTKVMVVRDTDGVLNCNRCIFDKEPLCELCGSIKCHRNTRLDKTGVHFELVFGMDCGR